MRIYKGYYVPSGYFGWVGDHYMLFDTIQEYYDYADEYYKEVERKCALESLVAQLPSTYQGIQYHSH